MSDSTPTSLPEPINDATVENPSSVGVIIPAGLGTSCSSSSSIGINRNESFRLGGCRVEGGAAVKIPLKARMGAVVKGFVDGARY